MNSSTGLDALEKVVCKLESKIQLLEIDNEFIRNNGNSFGGAIQGEEVLERAIAVYEDFCFLQTLLQGKMRAVEGAQKINLQLKAYINALEPLVDDPLGESISSNTPNSPNPSNEFIAFVGEREWELVPKYMRGKLNCDKINEYISSLNSIAGELVRLQRASTIGNQRFSKEQRDRLQEYRNLAVPETMVGGGRVWLLESEVKRYTEKTEMALRAMHTVLRHLGRIKEVRGGGHNRIVFLR
jgi:hypothetical protein